MRPALRMLALSAVTAAVVALAAPAFGRDVVLGADLEAEATAGGELVIGTPAERAVLVRNVGSGPASDVHVIAELPTGVRFATVLPVIEGGTCSVVSVGSPAGQALLADCVRRSLASGATATLRMPLVATADAPCGPLVTEVRVTAVNEPAANVDLRNRDTIADRLPCGTTSGPDLAVSVRALPDAPVPGRAIVSYRIELTNRGDEVAHGASASISLPADMLVRGGPRPSPAAVCTVTSSWAPPSPVHMAASCSFATLEPGDTAVVVVSGRVPPDPRCVDAVALAKARADDEPRELVGDENRAVATTTYACRPRIRISAHAPLAAHAGARVPVTVRVRNVSAAAIVDVRPWVGGCGTGVRRIEAGDGDRFLDPRERWTFACRRAVPASADPLVQEVAVTARDAARQATTARAARRIDVWHPAIALDVTAVGPLGAPGARATLQAEVRNVGDAPLTEILIAVPSLGAATIDSLSPGSARMIELGLTLPRQPGAVGTVTATATDRLGRDVTASDDVVLTVAAFTDGADPSGDPDRATGGTGDSAFTGGTVAAPGGLAVLLAGIGLVAIVAGRRRARP